ncbi:MAG TPA: TetR/AcrR family transcriptional regulator [Syntrophales bacterium]|nr:TetR/AcrR family transcriptional regulator [Syntrophales bacterium]HOL59934.1 TetR/AcrR family transcriptional regulator [Syntrophales bacterium]HPO36252.1 TetR/AcrR family transcriptional regulator [Syntrophales bacterium]
MSSVKNKSRKDRIMEAALRIFAEKCYQDATITEISKEAGVSEATVYEYFGTKEDLLFAIPERISNQGYDVLTHILPYIKGAEGRIRAIVYAYFNLYQNNPHYSGLVLLQLMTNKRFRQTEAFAAIRRSARLLLDCIREGIKEGTFRQDIDPYLVRSLLLGTIEHLFIHWHMRGRPTKPKDMMAYLDPLLEIVFSGIRAPKEEQVIFVKVSPEEAKEAGLIIKCERLPDDKAGAKESRKKGKTGKTIKRKEKVLC